MEEKNDTPVKPRRTGGLYARVNMSVRAANIMVAVLVAVLVLVTVRFDTDGGSQIESVRVLHSETVPAVEDPVKEGWQFAGWYRDRACTLPWNMATDTVENSMTLYAKWQQ